MDTLTEELNIIERGLEELQKKGGYSEEDIRPFQDSLLDLEENKYKGIFLPNRKIIEKDPGNEVIPPGQAQLHSKLSRCHRMASMMLENCEVAPELQDVVNSLKELRKELEEIRMTEGRRRAVDLAPIQERLQKIEEERRPDLSSFCQNDTSVPPPKGQGVAHDVLNRCHELVDEILGRDEDIEKRVEEKPFIHIANQLKSIQQRVKTFRRRGGYTDRDALMIAEELHELEIKMNNTIDQMKRDPNVHLEMLVGPNIVSSLFAQCYRGLHLLYDHSEVDPKLQGIYDQLGKLRDELKDADKAIQTQSNDPEMRMRIRKFMEETIQSVRRKLTDIEQKRSGAVFVPEEHGRNDAEILPGQAILHDLLYSCHSYLRKFTVWLDRQQAAVA